MDALKKFAADKLSGNDNHHNQNQQFQQGSNQGGYGGQQGMPGGMGGQGGYGDQSQGQNFGVTGGPQYNAPHGSGGAGAAGGMGGLLGMLNLDQGSAMNAAQANGANNHEDQSMFAQAFSMINNKGSNAQQLQDLDGDGDIDEDDAKIQYQRAYEQNQTSGMSANSMGAAAAMAAMKKFTSGSDQPAQKAGGNMQSGIVGMAMSEAAKLFDKSGGAASGGKQDAVNSAGMMMVKLMLKSKMSGGGTMGGSDSGGLGSLMGMAGKFL